MGKELLPTQCVLTFDAIQVGTQGVHFVVFSRLVVILPSKDSSGLPNVRLSCLWANLEDRKEQYFARDHSLMGRGSTKWCWVKYEIIWDILSTFHLWLDFWMGSSFGLEVICSRYQVWFYLLWDCRQTHVGRRHVGEGYWSVWIRQPVRWSKFTKLVWPLLGQQIHAWE